MSLDYNILVTGCGGDIGQSIGKILKQEVSGRVIGCDVSDENAASFIYDELEILPPVKSDKYSTVLGGLIEKYKIDLVIPVSEPELRFLSNEKIEDRFLGKQLICANLKTRETGFDKLKTSLFLKNSGLPYPETFVINEVQSATFPVILKSREGSGSKAIFILRSPQDFEYYQGKYPEFIIQELLADEDEHTCGLFRSKNGETRTLIYKRKLVDSYSGYGIVIEDRSINELLINIAKYLDLRGSINVQLRFSKKGPCVFEINPRFSSTVKFRDMMGFKDLIWSIQDAMALPISPYSPVPEGTRFFKGFEEYISLTPGKRDTHFQ